MARPSLESDLPDVDAAEVERTLRTAAAEQARAVLLGFGVVFALLGGLNLAFQPRPQGVILGGVNLATAAAFLALGWRMRKPSLDRAHWPVAFVALLAVVDTLVGMALFETATRVIFLVLVAIGVSLLTLSRRVLALALGTSGAAYAVGLALHGASGDWIIFGVALIASGGIAALFQGMRRRSAWRLESFRLALARRNEELERVLAESREKEARFRSVVEHGHDIITMSDPNGRVVYASPAIGPVLGWRPVELVGRVGLELVHPEDVAHAQLALATCMGTPEKPVTVSYRMQHKDGSWRHLETVATNLTHVPGVRGVVAASRDVTERIRLEHEAAAQRDALQRAERLSSLGTLVAGVAHEINNPLMYMQGNADLVVLAMEETLERPDLPADVQGTLRDALRQEEAIIRGIGRLGEITKGLRRAAKATHGQRAPEDVNALVDDVLSLAASRLGDHVRVVRELRAAQACAVNATEISQVLLNLVLNALDAMDGQGGGQLTLRTADEDDAVVVEIEDTGPGIPPDQQAKLFTPLHTTKATGTGLGLSVSYRIVEGHGGRMSFLTGPAGTTFRIELPRAAARATTT